jgi:hypothetical protein
LISKHETGLISSDGRFVPCFVKLLPNTNTQRTVLNFSKLLDQFDVQYLTYTATFKTILLPDRNKCSNELIQLLTKEPYNKYVIEHYFLLIFDPWAKQT